MKNLFFIFLVIVAISTAVVYFEIELPFGIGQDGIGEIGAEAVRTVATAVQPESRSETPSPTPAILPSARATAPAPTLVPTTTPAPQHTNTPIPTAVSVAPTPAPTIAPAPQPVNTPIPTAVSATPTPAPTITPAPLPTNTPSAAPTPTLADMIESVKPALVFIEPLAGSGFVIDESGLVVTNQHVVEGLDTVTIRMLDDRKYEGVVLGVDAIADLAVVQLVSSDKFEIMDLGNSNDVRVGDEVIALGFPWRSEIGTEPTITKGIISSNRIHNGVDVLQTDAAINPGNSGGPLVNRNGEVVGVNFAKLEFVYGRPIDNIGFSVTVNELKIRLDALKSGNYALLPTPEPASWTTYESYDYGYTLDIAPGWWLVWELEDGSATFFSEDFSGTLQVRPEYLDTDDILDKKAGLEYLALLETLTSAFETGFGEWPLFEVKSSEMMNDGVRDYYRVEYVSQISDEYCVQDNIALIFVSDFYPDEPYGFVVEGSICEESLDLYNEDRMLMLDRFLP